MTTRNRLLLQLLLTAISLLACALPARANLIVAAGASVANPGSTLNSFDVTLTNTGPSAATIGAFSFGLLLSNPDITFTGANTSTVKPYIFLGDSLFGPLISTTVGSTLVASDVELSGLGVTVGPGATVGLGHVLFSVAPSAAPGQFETALSPFPTTSLADPSANDVPVQSFIAGSIQIGPASAAVSEPSYACVFFALLCVSAALREKNPSRFPRSPLQLP